MITKYSNWVKHAAPSNTSMRKVKILENVWYGANRGGPQTFRPFLSDLQVAQCSVAAGALTLIY
jgi:hypothetical protein